MKKIYICLSLMFVILSGCSQKEISKADFKFNPDMIGANDEGAILLEGSFQNQSGKVLENLVFEVYLKNEDGNEEPVLLHKEVYEKILGNEIKRFSYDISNSLKTTSFYQEHSLYELDDYLDYEVYAE